MYLEEILRSNEKAWGMGWFSRAPRSVRGVELRIIVVRPGLETVQIGKGERIMWLKLASSRYEYLRADQADEFKAARKQHVKDMTRSTGMFYRIQRLWNLSSVRS